MSIYEDVMDIQLKIDNCFDAETGEIDDKKLAELEVMKMEIASAGLEKLCKVFMLVLGNIETHKNEANRIIDKMKKLESKRDWLEKYISSIFEMSDAKDKDGKINTGTFTLKMLESKRVIVEDGFDNKDYMNEKVTTSIDKMKIKKALEDNKNIKGARIEVFKHLKIT